MSAQSRSRRAVRGDWFACRPGGGVAVYRHPPTQIGGGTALAALLAAQHRHRLGRERGRLRRSDGQKLRGNPPSTPSGAHEGNAKGGARHTEHARLDAALRPGCHAAQPIEPREVLADYAQRRRRKCPTSACVCDPLREDSWAHTVRGPLRAARCL